jgi:hypothetical protein
MKKPIVSIMLFVIWNLSFAQHSVTSEQTHGDWLSLIINTSSGSVARAITVRMDDQGEISTFNIDSPAADCDSVAYSVNINLSEIQRESVKSPTLFGKFRVDNYPVHNITYTFSIDSGADYASLYIKGWSRGSAVLKEILSGNVARFQFKIENEAYYYRFSLKGSRQAVERQDRICRQLKEGDEGYFENSDDDEVYFTT